MRYLRLAAILLGIAVVVAGYLKFTTGSAKANQVSEPWPPFTMVFIETMGETTVKYRLDYRDRESWRLDLLDHSTRPEAVGTWAEHEAGYIRGYFAPFKYYSEGPAPQDGYHVVDEWLIPNRIDHLRKRGWVEVKAGGVNTVTLQTVHKSACGQCPSGFEILQETRTYLRDSKLPVSVRIEGEGKVYRLVQAVELVTHGR